TKEGDNRLGPHVWGIIGRKAGSLPNYSYSSALKGADFVWDEEKLERFIANPDETVPGNNMKPYGGVGSAGSRGKMITFLKTLPGGQKSPPFLGGGVGGPHCGASAICEPRRPPQGRLCVPSQRVLPS